VQLAICQKKILGYSSGSTGNIVPYCRSASLVKSECADKRCSVASASSSQQLPLATWETAPRHIREILLCAVRSGTPSLALADMKRIYRRFYNVELSETALGHAKLSELLTDERFKDICEVRMLGRSYAVLPSRELVAQSRRLSDSHEPGVAGAFVEPMHFNYDEVEQLPIEESIDAHFIEQFQLSEDGFNKAPTVSSYSSQGELPEERSESIARHLFEQFKHLEDDIKALLDSTGCAASTPSAARTVVSVTRLSL